MNKSSVCSVTYNGIAKPKKKFRTAEEAFRAAEKVNSYPTTIHKYWGYKCTTCHHFHIGKTKKPNNNFKELFTPQQPITPQANPEPITEPTPIQSKIDHWNKPGPKSEPETSQDEFDWTSGKDKIRKI